MVSFSVRPGKKPSGFPLPPGEGWGVRGERASAECSSLTPGPSPAGRGEKGGPSPAGRGEKGSLTPGPSPGGRGEKGGPSLRGRGERYFAVTDAGFASTSATLPTASSRPPLRPAPGPISTR